MFKISKPIIQKSQPIIHTNKEAGALLSILALSKIRDSSNIEVTMKKCFVLFIILVVALIFAAVSESKDMKIQQNWDSVAAEGHHVPR